MTWMFNLSLGEHFAALLLALAHLFSANRRFASATTVVLQSSLAYLWVAQRRAGVSPAPSSEASGESQTVRRDASPALSALEAVTDKSISFGFLFLTVGIISGAVWANSAWGTYWSWDP